MNYYLVGIKGTGMSHLAAYLKKGGAAVSGCDVEQDFFTKAIIENIPVFPLDSPLPANTDVLIYSTGYEGQNLRAFREAEERSVKTLSYPQALAELSRGMKTVGIAGTHGKSTTSAVAAYLSDKLNLEAGAIYGSFLQKSNEVYRKGERGLILEACEYQNHFLLYDLDVLAITSIEFDHPDFFKDLEEVRKSFRERIIHMPRGGVVIYHSSLSRLQKDWESERPDLVFLGYGDKCPFALSNMVDDYWTCTQVGAAFKSKEKNSLILYDYLCGAMVAATMALMLRGERVTQLSVSSELEGILKYLEDFPGLVARCEVVKEEGGVTYIDDYAHHPSEIKVCLENLRKKYPSRRIVAVFMPHTASRTKALLKDFVTTLSRFDAVFIQDTYSSARKDYDENSARVLEKALEKRVFRTFYGRLSTVCYTADMEAASLALSSYLMHGDVLVTLGAGDNRNLIERIAALRYNSPTGGQN